jgi:hypothetical protein
MNYPIWETLWLGGGTWIALIAILHVYISHLAVGGGLFIWITELRAWRENDQKLHDYLRRHVWFFLYLTMVFGGVTGVGIWFIIALVHPTATSLLIHNFVFGWAIEWVFFFCEIVALLLYAYRFDRMGRRERTVLAFFYALFAWLSLFIINGILSFMLTPGKWLETRGFWDGFFNPTFFPSLFFRTFMACVIAGLFGYVTALRLKDNDAKDSLVRYCTKWLIYPLPAAGLCAVWYFYALPTSSRFTTFSINQQTSFLVSSFLVSSVVLFVLGLVISRRRNKAVQKVAAVLLILTGLSWIGGFEYTREVARKPFVIGNYFYANSLAVSSQEHFNEKGVLSAAKWVKTREASGEGAVAAGRELFNIQCLACHTVRGVRNDVVAKTSHLTYEGIISQLTGQGKVLDYMPPVVGTIAEREALAMYIASLNSRQLIREPQPYAIKPSVESVVRNISGDGHLLLVWNDLGMHCMSDSDETFVFLPPANTLEAQLIKRGRVPEIVGEDRYELSFRVEKGFETPSTKSRFWDFSESNFGKKLPGNVGLANLGMSGLFGYEEELKTFTAKMIPVVPYPEKGGFNPYPVFFVEAKDKQSGKIVATAPVVAGVSTELGCRNCHGGAWRVDNMAGVSKETAQNILRTHDRLSHTDLLRQAVAGKPNLCQSCHPDAIVGSQGKPGVLNLAAAVHGWHANYVSAKGSSACGLCHPTDPDGKTRCSRGVHAAAGLTCVNCHGTLSDHALSLLKGQEHLPEAKRLMKNLSPVTVPSKEAVIARNPWMNEPDCLNCHKGYQQPSPTASGYNKWTKGFDKLYRGRTDNVGLKCTACHGTPHGEYPATNPYSPMKDNIVPLQYTGKPYPIGSERQCETCHVTKMQNSVHHKNMERPFRNKNLVDLKEVNRAMSGGIPINHAVKQKN